VYVRVVDAEPVRWVSPVRRPDVSNPHESQYGYLPEVATAPLEGAATQLSVAV
jgi:hypothetical protein